MGIESLLRAPVRALTLPAREGLAGAGEVGRGAEGLLPSSCQPPLPPAGPRPEPAPGAKVAAGTNAVSNTPGETSQAWERRTPPDLTGGTYET